MTQYRQYLPSPCDPDMDSGISLGETNIAVPSSTDYMGFKTPSPQDFLPTTAQSCFRTVGTGQQRQQLQKLQHTTSCETQSSIPTPSSLSDFGGIDPFATAAVAASGSNTNDDNNNPASIKIEQQDKNSNTSNGSVDGVYEQQQHLASELVPATTGVSELVVDPVAVATVAATTTNMVTVTREEPYGPQAWSSQVSVPSPPQSTTIGAVAAATTNTAATVNEFGNYSFQHGQPLPTDLSSPRTLWQAPEQIPINYHPQGHHYQHPHHHSVTPAASPTSGTLPWSSNNNNHASIVGVSPSDYSSNKQPDSPYDTLDLDPTADPDYHHRRGPNSHHYQQQQVTSAYSPVKLEDLATNPFGQSPVPDDMDIHNRQTSPMYTDDGIVGVMELNEDHSGDVSPSYSTTAGVGGETSNSSAQDATATSTSAGTGTGANRDGAGGGQQKQGKSYALLLYDCFMSHPEHKMTLQDIYAWFRENTDKSENETKGWQNSVRHNLSMNQAFVKKERREESPSSPTTPTSDRLQDPTHHHHSSRSGGRAATSSSVSKKPSNIWVLTDWAIRDGVQSTTRYRKNPNHQHHSSPPTSSSARRGGGGAVTNLGPFGNTSATVTATRPQHQHHHQLSSTGSILFSHSHQPQYDGLPLSPAGPGRRQNHRYEAYPPPILTHHHHQHQHNYTGLGQQPYYPHPHPHHMGQQGQDQHMAPYRGHGTHQDALRSPTGAQPQSQYVRGPGFQQASAQTPTSMGGAGMMTLLDAAMMLDTDQAKHHQHHEQQQQQHPGHPHQPQQQLPHNPHPHHHAQQPQYPGLPNSAATPDSLPDHAHGLPVTTAAGAPFGESYPELGVGELPSTVVGVSEEDKRLWAPSVEEVDFKHQHQGMAVGWGTAGTVA